MVIIDTLVTIQEIMDYQAKEMNIMSDSLGTTRIYSDTQIEAVINNVIRFVLGNAPSDVDENMKMFAIYELSKIELNNRMFTDHNLDDWTLIDTFDKEYLKDMLETKSEDDKKGIDLIPIGIKDGNSEIYKYSMYNLNYYRHF